VTPPASPRPARVWALAQAWALAFFGVVTVLATWPLAAHFLSHVPGDPRDPGDYWAYYWDLWWVKHALLDLRQSPLHTRLLYQPDGTSLYFHSLLLAPSALMAPITATLGPTVSYNLLVWLSFVGSALGVYLLVLSLLDGGPSRPAALLAGTAYALSAPRLTRMMGHLDLLSTQWLPFALLFALRTARDGGWRNGLALAVFTVLTGLTNWYLGASLVLALALIVCERLLTAGLGEAVRSARRMALPLIAAGLLTSPAWGGMLAQAGAGGRLSDPFGDSIANSADVVGFVLPSSAHPIWGHAVTAVRQRLFGPGENVVENTVFLGFVPLVLAVFGWRGARSPEARPFRWIWVVFLVLSLGPHLQVAGLTVRIAGHPLSLPYVALYHLPYGELAHGPARFILLAGLGQAVLAGFGAWRLLFSVSRAHATALFAALLTAAVFETAAVPYPLAAVHHPGGYDHLPPPGSGVLLEVPIPDWPAQLPQRMLYQTRHGWPVFGGYLSRSLPPHPFHALPGFRELKALALDARDIDGLEPESRTSAARVALRAYGTSRVMLLKDDFRYLPGMESKSGQARAVMVSLLGEPEYEDGESALFAVPDAAAPPFASPERGFFPVEAASPGPLRAMGARARIGAWIPVEGEYALALTASAADAERRVELRFEGAATCPASFSPSSELTAKCRFHATRGWHLADVTCPDSGPDSHAAADEPPCLVVSAIRLTPEPRARP
jgi:hypothetical protein